MPGQRSPDGVTEQIAESLRRLRRRQQGVREMIHACSGKPRTSRVRVPVMPLSLPRRASRGLNVCMLVSRIKCGREYSSCCRAEVRIERHLTRDAREHILDEYNGEGIQHIALGCEDIFASVDALTARGLRLQETPDTYFDLIDERLPGHGEDVEALRVDVPSRCVGGGSALVVWAPLPSFSV